MQDKELAAIGFSSLNNGIGLNEFRHVIWLLADRTKAAYNPVRVVRMLHEAITDKWNSVEAARQDMGMEPRPFTELKALLSKPVIDRGDQSIDSQLREIVREGFGYLSEIAPGWETEYPHVVARRNLGLQQNPRDDTPDQRKQLLNEELRVVHETELRAAIYDLGSAVDNQHRAYLQGRVDKFRDSVARYADPADALPPVPGKPPTIELQ